MKKITKVLTVVIAAVLAMTMCVMSVGAESIFTSSKAIESGKSYSFEITDSNKVFNYKIKVGKSGKLKINVTTYLKFVSFNVFDKDGSAVSYNESESSIKSGSYDKTWGRFKWGKNTETFKGTMVYDVKPGTYYIQFKQCTHVGKGKFNVSAPGADTASVSDSSNSSSDAAVMITIDRGDKLTLSALVSGKVKTVEWSTSDSSVATVSSKGRVCAEGEGTATITAKSGGKTLLKIVIEVL